MDYQKLAQLLYPDIDKTPEYYEEKYPPRDLPEGAKVTRFAPSPTGFVHFGGLFPVTVCERLAHQSGGVFMLRIEDTDSKREVEGAEMDIIRAFEHFGIRFDESIVHGGDYGPYRQSDRKAIYQCYAKYLVANGHAYPCFCSAEELDELRARQEEAKVTPGYYGEYVRCRDLSYEEVEANLKAGKPFVLRFRSNGNAENKVKITDLIKGNLEITENSIDHVLLKSDGIPTYHMAHAVDDHLMRTTHVIRGEEWLPSLPYHVQLFQALGFRLPKYMHISQLMRLEGTAKKKLSKRDAGAGITYYFSEGYAPECVTEYVMTLLNSNFEDWRRANPNEDIDKFPFAIKKMSPSGCLFDMAKLNDVCKNVVSRMDAETVYNKVTGWAKEYDTELYALLTRDPDYSRRILGIGRGGAKPRKDIALWKEVKEYVSFFFEELFTVSAEMPANVEPADRVKILTAFAESYDETADQTAWFDGIRAIAESVGYAGDMKAYKAEPEKYRGHIGDVSMCLRVAVTGRESSPDMYEVMKILGAEKVTARCLAAAKA